MKAIRRASLLALTTATAATAGGPTIDPVASYSGPFAGAQTQSEMAQSFEVSVSGYLHRIEAYVPMQSGDACELTWFLRDGATLDPQNPDISALPVLASGTGMASTPDFLYDAEPSVLLEGANIPIDAGDRLVLHVVRDCSFAWIAGVGLLPGDRYQFDGTTWVASSGPSLEFGRNIWVSDGIVPVEETSWSAIKAAYR